MHLLLWMILGAVFSCCYSLYKWNKSSIFSTCRSYLCSYLVFWISKVLKTFYPIWFWEYFMGIYPWNRNSCHNSWDISFCNSYKIKIEEKDLLRKQKRYSRVWEKYWKNSILNHHQIDSLENIAQTMTKFKIHLLDLNTIFMVFLHFYYANICFFKCWSYIDFQE